MKIDHRSAISNLSNCKEARKYQGFNGSRTRDLRDTGAMLHQLIIPGLLLSNCLTWKIYCNEHSSLSSQPKFKYELFHVYFTSFHSTGRYELNKMTSLPLCGVIAQLVEHRTAIAEVTGSTHVKGLVFSGLLLSNCLNWKTYCDDHSVLHLQPQYKHT